MGDQETKQRSPPKDPKEEAKGQILSEFYLSLGTATAALAVLGSIDFEGLPQTEQSRLELTLLREAYTTIDRDLALNQQLTRRESAPKQEILINPNPIRVTVVAGEKTAELTLGHDRKGMLAYFVALTQEMVKRHMQPWITAKELCLHINLTRNQLYDHFFGHLVEAGVIEMHARRGYRLLCKPADAWDILQSGEPYHFLQVVGFDSWAGTDLIKDHQIKLLRVLSDQCQTVTAGGFLDTQALRERTGLSRDWLFASLKELENFGLIRRSGNRYKIKDLNLQLINEIVEQNNVPILINYIKMAKPQPRRAKIEDKRAPPLDVKAQEEFEFPAAAWREKGIDVSALDFGNQTKLLCTIDQILTTKLDGGFAKGTNGLPVYIERIPQAKDIEEQIILGVLDFLGIGPEELKFLLKDSNDTLAASLKKLENSSLLKEQLFLAEVKARLAGFIFDEIIAAKEGGDIGFADLMGMLEESLKETQPEPVETTLPEEEAPTTKVPVREKRAKPDQRSALLATLQGPLKKEIAAATSQQTYFVGFLPPVAAFNFHRILSDKADFIPWEKIIAFGFAEKGVSDHHPRINAAGALIAALYLTPSVHNRFLPACKTETRALKTLTECAYHLLAHMSVDAREEKKAKYIQDALAALKSTL